MKIRIHETDFDGTPVACTGEFFEGETALEFLNHLAKLNYASFEEQEINAK